MPRTPLSLAWLSLLGVAVAVAVVAVFGLGVAAEELLDADIPGIAPDSSGEETSDWWPLIVVSLSLIWFSALLVLAAIAAVVGRGQA